MGFINVMHVDGDTAPLRWEVPITDYIRSSSGPFANASSDAFLYVSQDFSRFGAYQPTKRDFKARVACHSNGMLSGPNNFGVWLMRRSAAAFAALDHLVAMSTTQGRRYQVFPAEQGVLNAWLGQNCSCTVDPADASRYKCPPWSKVLLTPTWPCAYAQAKYGTFQRFLGRLDEPVIKKEPRAWPTELTRILSAYRDQGVFILHTPSLGGEAGSPLRNLTFKMV